MKVSLLFTFFIASLSLEAQIKISGKITDKQNNPIQGASISIKNTYDGSTTDSSGRYEIVTNEKGNGILYATMSGFSSVEKSIRLDSNQTIDILIKELITELKAVILSAGSFEASDQKRTTVFSSIDIVTTANANADISTAIKTLPGTQQVGDQEGLFVRGGTANESKTFIDGTLVNNFYYSSQPGLAQRGRFNPFLFKGTVFSAGGYSALYGQALSSALILESIDLPERSSATLSFSYLSVGGGLQQLSKNKKFSWGITYDHTDLRFAYKLIKQKPDYFKLPLIRNLDANFRIRVKGGILKYYGIFSNSDVGFRYEDIDSMGMKNSFSLGNRNMYQNISWKQKLNNSLRMSAGVSFTNNKDVIKGEFLNEENQKQNISEPIFQFKNFDVISSGKYLNGKLVFEKKLAGLSVIRIGSEYNYSKEKSDYEAPAGKISDTISQHLIAGFAETDIYITNNIAAKLGLRTEHSGLLNKGNVSPRLSLAYKLKNNDQLSFAYGIFYQDPETKYFQSENDLKFSKATHYILQYQKLTNRRTFRTEIFYKNYDDLFKTSSGYGKTAIINNSGSGYAKGIEVFWRDKKSVKNFDYWISYSFLDSKRNFMDYPTAIQPSFAAKHTASLVVKKFVSDLKMMINGSYTYASGRPYYHIQHNNVSGLSEIKDQGLTRSFNSAAFSINYLPNIAKTGANKFTVFVFSVTNVFGSNNIYGYKYSYNGENKQPVLPAAKRFYFLGCFLSFGIDRTDDAINNNL